MTNDIYLTSTTTQKFRTSFVFLRLCNIDYKKTHTYDIFKYINHIHIHHIVLR